MLGGTGFVGRAVVAEALRRGWQVTAFHRGNAPDLPGVRGLRGDRSSADGTTALAAGEWDLAVDTWSGAPVAVRRTARMLAGRVGHYGYVSSRSVYVHPRPAGAPTAESAPVVAADADGPATEYARDKRGAEIAVGESFPDACLLARAGLILGPHEDIGRLPWWLLRISRGGAVLAPGPPELPLQYVDARDLAVWLLDAGARGLTGAFDTASRSGHATMGSLLEACVAATGSAATLRWAAPEALRQAGIEPWTDLPVWLPPGELHTALHGADTRLAHSAGLRCRPVAETVEDTWRRLSPLAAVPLRADRPPVGLDAAREREVLATL